MLKRRSGLSAGDIERARSWTLDIAKALLPDGTPWHQEGEEWHPGGTKLGLSINGRHGAWYAFAVAQGGWEPTGLIKLLRTCSDTEATDWLAFFLSANPGTGSISGADDDTSEIEKAELAKQVIARLVPAAGTPVESYLHGRGIKGEIPSFVQYLPDARPGEGAIAALLTANGRVVGVQVGFIDPGGRKTLVKPYRRRFMVEKAPGAVFKLLGDPKVPDPAAGMLVAEGLEDMLSVAELGRLERLIGIPGIDILKHVVVRPGEKVIVIRDGDAPDAGASTGLVAGVDALILAGAVEVRVTLTPLGEDANSILQAGGIEALAGLIDTASAPWKLSREGEIERLSRLDLLEYDKERKKVVDRIEGHEDLKGTRLGTLDREVSKRRPKVAATADDDKKAGKAFEFVDTTPHPDSVDGAALMPALIESIGKHVIMTRYQRIGVALWVIFAHLFDIAETAPKLYIKSPLPECGKTRLMRVVRYLSPRPLIVSNATASSVFRIIEMHCPTLLLDEADTFVKDNEELRGILDSGFDRDDAAVLRNVSGPDGTIEPRIFSTWCPQVLAGIASLKPSIMRRCFVIELQRKSKAETVAKLTRRTAGPLLGLAQKVARWANDHRDMVIGTMPQIPEGMSDRLDEGWEMPLAIAEVIGGEWAEQARHAALAISGEPDVKDADGDGTLLLGDIQDALAAQKAQPDRISSDALATFLNSLEGRPWAEFNRGNPLTKNGLARLLKPFHIYPGTIQIGSGKGAHTPKGYYLRQFTDAFERYLSPHPPISGFSSAKTPGGQDFRGTEADFETARDTSPGVLKNPENPSVSAAPAVLAVENPEMEVHAEKTASLDAPRPNGPDAATAPETPAVAPTPPASGAASDGTAPPGRPPLTDLERDIVADARRHPGRSIAAVAKAFGQPAWLVAELLGRPK